MEIGRLSGIEVIAASRGFLGAAPRNICSRQYPQVLRGSAPTYPTPILRGAAPGRRGAAEMATNIAVRCPLVAGAAEIATNIAGRCPLVAGAAEIATNIAGRCPLVPGCGGNGYKYCGALPLFGQK
jgi:hypothetical protein